MEKIILSRILKEEKDFFSIFMYIVNPFSYVIHKIIAKFRGY
jgi:hypothetical protein